MNYPTLTEIASTRQMVDVFGGYNHNLRINDGEFYDMKNLTSSYYPVLSPRSKRGTYISVSNPLGMIAKDSLCYVDGGSFYINQYKIEGLILDENAPKTLVSMGAYVVIFPDRKWVNTAKFDGTSFDNTDGDGYGDIDAQYETAGNGEGGYTWTKFTLCTADGSSYDDTFKGDSEPKYTEDVTDEEGNTKTVKVSPPNGKLWLDTSKTPHSLKMYSASSGMWVSIATTYIKISSPGISDNFEVFDGIKIEGLAEENVLTDYTAQQEDGTYPQIAGHTREQLADLEGSAVVWAKNKDDDEDYIVVVGILDEEKTINNKITITRKAPDMDFVIENQNRLWGCKYGIVDGETVNEIYVSKQGDFKNWNCFMGLSTDSYAASCGTDGEFTGAVTHMGYPLFIKEGFMHKVYGNYPANFQIQTTACRGVQKGCHNSLAIVNEVLYYKSRSGVMAYDGSLPTEVSYALGEVSYDNAVACGHGNKYYISMRSGDEYTLFVYDTKRGVWLKEDNTQVDMFCSCRGELYYIPHGESVIKTMFGSGYQDTDKVEWMAETGVMSVSSPDKKYISRLNVRMSLAIGTRVYFYIQYDSMGEWEHISSMAGTALRTFTVPIRPKRCDHMRLRIVGEGDAKIYSITKTIEQGSDT